MDALSLFFIENARKFSVEKCGFCLKTMPECHGQFKELIADFKS